MLKVTQEDIAKMQSLNFNDHLSVRKGPQVQVHTIQRTQPQVQMQMQSSKMPMSKAFDENFGKEFSSVKKENGQFRHPFEAVVTTKPKLNNFMGMPTPLGEITNKAKVNLGGFEEEDCTPMPRNYNIAKYHPNSFEPKFNDENSLNIRNFMKR